MNYIISSITYLIILCVLGYLIGQYFMNMPLREGARTLPRPVINQESKKPVYEYRPSPPYNGETLNQMIDRYINMYFDKRGVPFTQTIQFYVNNCVNQGNVTEENKRKLTDIFYYVLNIVIPNMQTTTNPEPEQKWPPIKWTSMDIFNVLVQQRPTYKLYKGQPYGNSYTSGYNSSFDFDRKDEGNKKEDSGSTGTIVDPSSGADGSNFDNNGNPNCEGSQMQKCGLGCPNSCLDGIMAAWVETHNVQQEREREKQASRPYGAYTYGGGGGANWFDQWWNTNDRSLPANTRNLFLPNGGNALMIGNAEIDGYVTIDEEQTNPKTPLNDKIDAFIKDFFIADGPNKNRPTQKAIDTFNMYFQYRGPMDGIHMNKLRDAVYYILQIVIPGLPTSQTPRPYVEWRPIVWLSLSERKKKFS